MDANIKNSPSPRISVVMPVYNCEKYLREAIDSILVQIFFDFEFIIIDDGSTDHSAEIIHSYNEIDRRIRVISNPENSGLAKSLNKGITAAKGEYIARMDADDISLPDRLMSKVQFLEKNPSIDIVGSWIEIIDEKSQPAGVIREYNSSPMALRWITFFKSPVAHPAVMIRKKIISDNFKYIESDEPSEDYALWLKLITTSRFSNIQRPLLKYRVHQASITEAKRAEQFETSSRISQGTISAYLGEEVSLEVIKLIRRPTREASIAVYKTSITIMREIFRKFKNNNNLQLSESVYIRLEFAKKIFLISNRNHHFFSSWFFWIYSTVLMIYTLLLDLILNKHTEINRNLQILKGKLV